MTEDDAEQMKPRARAWFEEQDAEDVSEDHAVNYTALCLAAAACALPMLTMKPLGFVITCTGCFVLVAAAFKSRRWHLDLVLGLGFSLLCWWLFRKLGVHNRTQAVIAAQSLELEA